MIRWGTLLLELIAAAIIFVFGYKYCWKKFGQGARIAALVLSFCAIFISCSAASTMETPTRVLTITVQGRNETALEPSVYLTDIILDGVSQGVPEPDSGQWTWHNGRYCWFEPGDERLRESITESITFKLPAARKTELAFLGNKWKGIVSIQIDGTERTFDTYVDSDDGVQVRTTLAPPSYMQVVQTVLFPALGFGAALLLQCALLAVVVSAGQKVVRKFLSRQAERGPFQKLLKYQFLFEELVKRDFKKKYKRTVLGMVWSVLSPLLTLLVMRIVFTQFFGRNMAHYTTFLFCGNLVFSYFNDSTGQGMTSLMGNAGIFTKVNVPKYLFLLSKNIQTLINFCLTLCVFFVFCVIDQITFTWKCVLLLYPICCLVLFNIGIGLILSALFVFFRDIQYLWSVFTMLLMYMSAIFYNIDGYSYEIQCAFLLNPVYLFIRYFRKIVIDATIPTIWFHLLILADVAIVLGIGCWMYKKYNTKFLYYV